MTGPASPTRVLLVTTMGAFLAPFMSSALNVAIPAISREFGATASLASWVVTSFIVASAVFLLPMGRLADLVGRERVFLAGIGVYTAASLAAAAAPGIGALIAVRAVQGAGAAMLFATAVALLMAAFPASQRGRVLGINVASVYVGLSTGPVVGGLLAQHVGWRAIFLLSGLAAVLLALLPALALVRVHGTPAGGRFDWPGSALWGGTVVAAMAALSGTGGRNVALMLGALALAAGAAFVAVEVRATSPLVELGLFTANRAFALSSLAALLHYGATFAVSYLLALELQVVLGYQPRTAGLILLAQPVLMAILSPLAGRVSDRAEARLVASLGMAVTTAGIAILALAGRHLIAVLAGLAVVGVGFALFSSPNTNAVMSAVGREQLGVAAAVLGAMRLLGQASSMGIVTLVLGARLGGVELAHGSPDVVAGAAGAVFTIFVVLSALAVAASLAGRSQRPLGSVRQA